MNISEIPDAGRRSRKRANECFDDADHNVNNEPHSKISKFSTSRTSFYIKLAEESPARECDSDASTYDSFHGRETDLCRDTSDTEDYSSDEETIAAMAVVEYELASSNESDADTDQLSSSGTDDFMIAAVAHAICDDSTSNSSSDFSLFADTEESDSASDDPELGKADYWECVKCKNRQNNPLYRYCEKCYQLRKNLFPPRPKKNRKTRLSQPSGLHKVHRGNSQPVFGKAKNDYSYMRENNVCRTVSKVNLEKSKEANSAGESGKSDDSDNEYNHKNINYLNKSPKMCKRRKRLSNRTKLTNNSTNTTDTTTISGDKLDETSKNFIVLLNNNNTDLVTDTVEHNAINVNPQSSSTKSTDSSNNNQEYCSNLSSHSHSIKRTCDSVNIVDSNSLAKRIRLDETESDKKKIQSKMFKNVIENWSGNSDSDTGSEPIKLTPPNELDLISSSSSNKDSGFSSSSSQELSPVIASQEFLNDKAIENSSQETYCADLEIEDEPSATQVYATSSTESSTLSESSEKNDSGLLSRNASSCSDFVEIVSKLKSQDSFERNSQNSNSEGFEMCMMCLTEPKNGVFVHNRFLHSCCCYRCAMKVWAKNKRCPICNCKVKNVMKLFVY